MATTKLGNTKSSSRAINYAEKRAVVKSGHNCDVDYAKSNFKQLRCLYGKDDGVQAHTIIQSFKPGEVSAEKANEIGLELAKSVAKGHQVAVYTHADTDHIHNHIIINSVNMENGKKYQSNAKQRHFVKDKNDEICRNHGLSVVTEKNANIRHTLAEKQLIEKGKSSWKDEIRTAVNIAKIECNDFEGFQSYLKSNFEIDTKLRGNTLSFKHPERDRYVRGKSLGNDYEGGTLKHEFARKVEAKREWTSISNSKNERDRKAERAAALQNERNNRHNQGHDRDESDNQRKSRKRTRQKDYGMELLTGSTYQTA